MGVRTVRLDEDAERRLAELCRATGLSIPEVLKRGLDAFAEAVHKRASASPYEIYRRLDFGPGGDAVAPASRAKTEVAKVIGAKHGR